MSPTSVTNKNVIFLDYRTRSSNKNAALMLQLCWWRISYMYHIICYQRISSPTSVTNTDVARTFLVCLHFSFSWNPSYILFHWLNQIKTLIPAFKLILLRLNLSSNQNFKCNWKCKFYDNCMQVLWKRGLRSPMSHRKWTRKGFSVERRRARTQIIEENILFILNTSFFGLLNTFER